MRIDGHIASQSTNELNTLSQAGQAGNLKPLGEQVQQTLFSRPRPLVLDAAMFPELDELMRVLNRYRRKLSIMAGDGDEAYSLVLADDTIAAIDEHGTIFMGAAFLRTFKHQLEVPIGAMAHEIGHRPKRWRELRYQTPRDLSNAEREALCRTEETRADIFAGKGLAELSLSCEPLVEFLMAVSIHPHPEYLPAEDRARVIREAHAARLYRADNRRKTFPDFHRHTSPDGYLGEF